MKTDWDYSEVAKSYKDRPEYSHSASCITAWQSHVTLKRQAGTEFKNIISEISCYLNSLHVKNIAIPYRTKIYMGRISK